MKELQVVFFSVCLGFVGGALAMMHFRKPTPPAPAVTEAKEKAGDAVAAAKGAELGAIQTEALELAEAEAKPMIEAHPLPDRLQALLDRQYEYTAALEGQLTLETERAEAWRASAEMWRAASEANAALAEAALAEVETSKKAAWWKGLKAGTLSATAVAVIVLVLL